MAGNTIADMTREELTTFIQRVIQSTPPALPPALKLRELTTTRRLVVEDEILISPQAVRYLQSLGL